MNIQKIAELIGNKKIIAAVNSDNRPLARAVSGKLYSKARSTQDAKEYLLGLVIDWADNNTIDFDKALNLYASQKANDACIKDVTDLCASEKYRTEADSLKRHCMKADVFDDEAIALKTNAILKSLSAA